MAEQKKCRCRILYPLSSNIIEAKYRCRCGKSEHVVKLTKEEKKAFKKSFFSYSGVNDLSHKLQKHINKSKEQVGYGLMGQIDKFIAKNPQIIECHVDDDYHAGSSIYLIPHEDQYKLWGVSCMYVPQCTGEKPIRFFLYPGHLNGLIEGLEKMAAIAKKHRYLDKIWQNKKEPGCFDFLKTISKPKKLQPTSSPPKLRGQKKIV
jgi:hypothetical protein